MSKVLERKIILKKSEFTELILTLILKKDNVFVKIGDGSEKTHYHILNREEMLPVITNELENDRKLRHTWRSQKKTSIQKMVRETKECIDYNKKEMSFSNDFIVAVPTTKMMDITDKLSQQKTTDLIEELMEDNVVVEESDGEIINIDDPSMYKKIVFCQLYRKAPHFGYYRENEKIIVVYATKPFIGTVFPLDSLIDMVLGQAKEMGLLTYLGREHVIDFHPD